MKSCNLGLALSGGGARGLAHAGVLQALHELDVSVDMIAGTSSGALVGLLYAAGIPPLELPKIIKKSRLIDVTRINFGFSSIFRNDIFRKVIQKYIKVNNFEDLNIPLIVCTTDFTNARTMIFDSGPFTDPVVASCSIPFIFPPVLFNGVKLVDGGLLNNFPVDLLSSKCSHLAGVHVNPLGKQLKKSVKFLIERSCQMAVSSGIPLKKGLCDVYIEPLKLEEYSVFDTRYADEIFKCGYDEAMKYKSEFLKIREGSQSGFVSSH